MKVIIAGSRGITDYKEVLRAIVDADFDITEVVSGGARGVDRLGEHYARLQKIPIKRFTPEWKCEVGFNPRAGLDRNVEMAGYADALIAIWDDKSKGTKHMIEVARRAGLQVFVCHAPEPSDPGTPPRRVPTGL